MNFQHAITLVILGTKGAGKSALIQRFKDNTFDPSSHGKPTKSRVFEFWYHLPPHLIGSAASVDKKKTSPRSSPTSTSPKTEASEVIKIRLIDTGEVNDMELINQWIEASDGIIFVHDIHASANSWGDLYMKWMKKILSVKAAQARDTLTNRAYVPFLLLANKYGEPSPHRSATSPSVQTMKREHVDIFERYLHKENLVLWDSEKYSMNDVYIYVCARTGHNIQSSLENMVGQVIDQRKEIERIRNLQAKMKKKNKRWSLLGSKSMVDDLSI